MEISPEEFQAIKDYLETKEKLQQAKKDLDELKNRIETLTDEEKGLKRQIPSFACIDKYCVVLDSKVALVFYDEDKASIECDYLELASPKSAVSVGSMSPN